MPGFFLNGIGKMFMGNIKHCCCLVQFHKLRSLSADHLINVPMDQLQVLPGELAASCYCLFTTGHFSICKDPGSENINSGELFGNCADLLPGIL